MDAARSGMPAEHEILLQPLGKWVRLSLSSPAEDHVVLVAEDITASKQHEREALTHVQTLGLLQNLNHVFIREDNLQTVLDEIVAAAAAISGAEMAQLELIDAQSGKLHIVAHTGFSDLWLNHWSTHDESAAESLERCRRLCIEDLQADGAKILKGHRKTLRQSRIRGFVQTPVLGREGRMLGVIVTASHAPQSCKASTQLHLDLLARATADILQHFESERSLQRKEEELREAQRLGHVGSWLWNPQAGAKTARFSTELLRLFGLPLTQPQQVLHDRKGGIFPDHSWSRLHRAMQKTLRTAKPFSLDAEAAQSDGTVRWVSVRGEVARSETGAIVGLRGTMQDITDSRRAREALRESELRFRGIYMHAALGIVIIDLDGRFVQCNPAYCGITGYTEEDLSTLGFQVLLEPLGHEAIPDQVRRLRTGAQEHFELEGEYPRKDGGRVPVHMNVSLLPDVSGEPAQLLVLVTDMTQTRQAMEALRDSEARFGVIFHQAITGITQADLNGRLTAANDYFCQMLGYTRTELLALSLQDITHPDDLAICEHEIRQLVQGGANFHLEKRYLHKDGTALWVNTRVNAIRDAEGHVQSLVGMTVDITEQKRLSDAYERLARLLNLARDTVFMRDMEDRITFWNRGAEERYGWRAEEALGRTAQELLVAELPVPPAQILAELQATGHWEGDLVHHARDGSPLMLASRWSLERDRRGRPLGILEINNDISARLAAERALQASEERLRLALDGADMGSWEWDLRSHRFRCNAREFQLLELSPEDRPQTVEEFLKNVHSEDRDGLLRHVAELQHAPGDHQIEFRVTTADGGIRWLAGKGRVVRTDAGEPESLYGVHYDITDSKLAEQRLREGRRMLELAIEGANLGTWDWNLETQQLRWNEREFKLLDLQPRDEQVPVEEALNRLHPEDRQPVMDAIDQALRDNRGFHMDFRVIHTDGSVHWLAGSARPVLDGGRITRIAGVNFDITERVEATRALANLNATLEQLVKERTASLQNREERLNAILNTAHDAIITIDFDGIITGINPATTRMFGYTEAELVGHDVRMLMPSPYREEHDAYLAHYLHTNLAQIIGAGREVPAQRKNGTIFPIELAVSEIRHLRLFTGVIRDISERKRLEHDLLDISEREQCRIGMDLHDGLGQEITAISIFNNSILQDLRAAQRPEAANVARLGDMLTRAGREMRQIARGLQPVEKDPSGLMAALENLAALHRLTQTVTFILECPEKILVHDHVAATHLYRIVQEAVQNALKHGKPSSITVRLLRCNHRVVVEIQDDGNGHREVMNGDGLGLRTMRYRTHAMSGIFEIYHPSGGGTLIHCSIPETAPDQSGDIQFPLPGLI